MMNKLEKAKGIIKAYYDVAKHGIFNSRNFVGDMMTTIYIDEELTIDICYNYEYFEVFGLSDADFKELERYYHSLGKKKEYHAIDNCKDCKQEVKSEPLSAISEKDLSKALVLGLALGFGEAHDEMDSIKKAIEQTFTPVQEIKAEIEKHCALIKESHCKLCSSCHCLMSVREILELIDKHGGKEN